MSGSNGRDKYVTCNREDEIYQAKFRGVSFNNWGNMQVFSAPADYTLSINSIFDGMLFNGAASGIYSWPTTYTAAQFLTDLRKYGPLEQYGYIDGIVIQNDAGNFTLNLPPGCVDSFTGLTSVPIVGNWKGHLKIELRQLSPVVFVSTIY
jgi:hypothetical protein